MRPWLAAAVVLCTVSGAAAGTGDRASAREQLTLPAPVQAAGELDGTLLRVARAAAEKPGRALELARAAALDTREGKVRVILDAEAAESAAAAVRAAGGEVERTYDSLVQALVPPARLLELAVDPAVRAIERPSTFQPAAVPGEGVAAIDALDAHAGGIDGSGVAVAIFDSGFAGYAARQASGDLPAVLTTRSFCADGFENAGHGTAVAEVVHEVAPAAELHLVCINTAVDLGRAAEYAVQNGIDVINMSGGFFNSGDGSGTGTGAFASTPDGIAKQTRDSGLVWVNAAGNEALTHWSGPLADPDGDRVLDFAAGDEGNSFTLGAGASACVFARWQAWSGPATDFDLYLTNAGGAVVLGSEGSQAAAKPTEELCFTNGGPTQTFSAALVHRSGPTTPELDLFVVGVLAIEYADPRGSLLEPAASSSVLSVGAVCWRNGALQPYSSRGLNGQGASKPDVVAPSAVSSATYGGSVDCDSGFTGTSAATPHVAGLVALLKERHPGHSASQLENLVRRLAVDVGAPRTDLETGIGIVRAWADPPEITDSFVQRGADGVPRVGARISSPVPVSYRWEYGNTPSYGSAGGHGFFAGNPEPSAPLQATASLDFGGAGPVFTRLVATSAFGTSVGPAEVVPALLQQPSVATLSPVFDSVTDVRLGVFGSGNGVPAGFGVEYGPTSAYGSRSLGQLQAGTYAAASSEPVRLQPGTTYHFRAIAVNALGQVVAAGRDAAFTTPVDIATVNPGSVSIAGSAQVGATLSASTGQWFASSAPFVSPPTPSLSYQWLQCDAGGGLCAPIVGATGASYGVRGEDGGRTLRVTVTGSVPWNTGSATSAATSPVNGSAAGGGGGGAGGGGAGGGGGGAPSVPVTTTAATVAPAPVAAPAGGAAPVVPRTPAGRTLTGNAAANVLRGTAGPDVISGRAGNDRIYGGAGRDRIDGGTGNDRIFVRDGVRDVVRCGPGRDRVSADKRDAVARDCEFVSR